MPTVLIVDDEYGLAEMAAGLLSIAGYEVVTAMNGKLALTEIEHAKPDVILTDAMMPVMSGPEMIVELQRHESTRHIPVILMSAAGREWVPPEAMEHVAAYLQKPFTYDELVSALERVLRVN